MVLLYYHGTMVWGNYTKISWYYGTLHPYGTMVLCIVICNQGLRALWECLLSCSRQLPLLAEAQALAWELWSGSREL